VTRALFVRFNVSVPSLEQLKCRLSRPPDHR
jgi:hypothetical protein